MVEKFYVLFWLETSKNDHSKGEGTSQKCPFIPRIVLLFSEIALLFSRSALLFLRGEVPFYVSKCPVFQIFSLVFQKHLFIYCACLFSGMLFFSADCTFSTSCSELPRDNIFLALGTLY